MFANCKDRKCFFVWFKLRTNERLLGCCGGLELGEELVAQGGTQLNQALTKSVHCILFWDNVGRWNSSGDGDQHREAGDGAAELHFDWGPATPNR